VSAPVEALPLVGSLPLQPPEAVQVLAFVAFQVRVAAPPLVMLDGFAVSVTIATGRVTVAIAVALALPPSPLQVSV
jgi:hypothetical protein